MPQQIVIERIGDGQLPERKDDMNCGFKWYFKSDTFASGYHINPNVEITKIEFANPIGITPEDVIPTEFTIEIQGQCNKCGYCCGYRNKKLTENGCSHIVTTGNNKGECAIYETRSQYCEEHGEAHEYCEHFPRQPVKKFNLDCGYSFIVITPDIILTGHEIIFFEVANFTGHLTEGVLIRQ